MVDFVDKDSKCLGPLCKVEFKKGKSWSKFCSGRCKFNYHMIKNAVIMNMAPLSKPAALDMLENLKRRIEKEL